MKFLNRISIILALAGCLATTGSVIAQTHSPFVPQEPTRANSLGKGQNSSLKNSKRSPAAQESGLTDQELERRLNALTLQQKVGQLFLIGFMGTDTGYALDKAIDTVKPGGIVVFSRNIKTARQISNLTLAAQKHSLKSATLPLFVAVDQEGGDVLRIRTTMPLPSALSLGDTNEPKLVEEAGHETGILLKTLGFNMNLAPVLDISDPAEKSFIGTRTFGSEPARVSAMGVQFASGLEEAGVLSTAKHFPGHGGVKEDSHRETPEKDTTLEEMRKNDLMPFAAMKAKMDDHWAVMLAHISYPKLDPSGLPATFSKAIVTGVLRKQMGFNGLVITDDIEMAGASIIADTHERALKAIEAGADMIMVAWNRKLQTDLAVSLYKAVKSGRLSEVRLNESVRRIIAFKARYATTDPHNPTDEELRFAIQNPKLEEIGQEVVRSKFARIDRRITPAFDVETDGKPVFVFTASDRFYKTFRGALETRKSRHYHLGEKQNFDLERVMRMNPDALGLLYLSGPRIARIASQISEETAKRIVVVNVETEGALQNASSFRLIADVYYRHPNLGALTAEHLFNKPQSRAVESAAILSAQNNRVPASSSKLDEANRKPFAKKPNSNSQTLKAAKRAQAPQTPANATQSE